MPGSVAEVSDRTFTRSSMGFTGLILQREHQTMACCSDVSQLPVRCCSVLCRAKKHHGMLRQKRKLAKEDLVAISLMEYVHGSYRHLV